jgi:hypothetical protein
MRWTCFAICLFLLTQTGCSSGGGTTTSEVRFLIPANGNIDVAIKDGRFPTILFPEQKGSEATITMVESSNQLDPTRDHGFKPGAYTEYSFPLTFGPEDSGDVEIFVEKPLTVKGPFKLTNIKLIGTVALSGTTKDGGGMNGAGHRAFSATVEPFNGKVENTYKADEGPNKGEK